MQKHITVKTPYHSILESVEMPTIRNALVGSCNLTADYLNDFSADGIRSFVAEFLQDEAKNLDKFDIELVLENPDYIIQASADTFQNAIGQLCEDAQYVVSKASYWFDAWGKYYVFVNGDTAACYVIRAENESEAYNELVTRFEEAFVIDEEEAEEDTERNDNGNTINTDYLVMLGSIQFIKQ